MASPPTPPTALPSKTPPTQPHQSENLPRPPPSPSSSITARITSSASSLARDLLTNPHTATAALASSNAATNGSEKAGPSSRTQGVASAATHLENKTSTGAQADSFGRSGFRSSTAQQESQDDVAAWSSGNALGRWEDYAPVHHSPNHPEAAAMQAKPHTDNHTQDLEESWSRATIPRSPRLTNTTSPYASYTEALDDVHKAAITDGASVVALLSSPTFYPDLDLTTSLAELDSSPSATDLFGPEAAEADAAPAFQKHVLQRLPAVPSSSRAVVRDNGLNAVNELDSLLARTSQGGLLGHDMMQRERLFAEWDAVLRRYTDKVWGADERDEKGAFLDEAKGALEGVLSGRKGDEAEGERKKALRRLEMVLKHVKV